MKINQMTAKGFLALLLLLLIALAIGMMNEPPFSPPAFSEGTRSLSFVYEWSGQRGEINPPHQFSSLPPRTKVVLTTELTPRSGESLYVKSVYAPLRVYVDDTLLYECGQEGSYPAFLLDPPTLVTILPLSETGSVMQLRFEYLSPTQRTVLSVPEVIVGSQLALVAHIFAQYGFSLLFSILLLFMGSSLLLIAALFLRTKSGSPLFHLGLFALAVGAWGFGECNLTAFLIPYPSLLYLLAFAGLFTLAIPLLKVGLLLLNPQRECRILLTGSRTVLVICVVGALALQLTGKVGLHRSMYLFHVIVPISFVILGGCVLWEYFRYRNQAAKRFAVPGLILALSAVLEVMNYNLRFTNVMSLFFQVGMLLFIFWLGVIAGSYSRQVKITEAEKARLEVEVNSMGQLLELQRAQYMALAESTEQAKAARHDLRHQLAVMRKYLQKEDIAGAREFCDKLSESIPTRFEQTVCENFAINAVALHYLALAHSEGIRASVKLKIPQSLGEVQDKDLCIIVGNFLENAIEACRRMAQGERFITMNAVIQGGFLIVVMDNSFDGSCKISDGVYLSRKHDGAGIGLSSVKSVAEKYGGSTRFEAKGEVFLSSAMVRLRDEADLPLSSME